jgi:dihydrofolate reductase
MTVSLIVAAATNDVIGSEGGLPWHLPDDLRNFKRLTTGKPVIMGRKTFESIGRPLPDRRNIVITRNTGYLAPGCEIVATPEAAMELASDAEEAMVIGGGEVYAAFLPLADRVYLTRVHADVDGDAVFPSLDDDWVLVASEAHPADTEHRHAFDFMIFERRPPAEGN